MSEATRHQSKEYERLKILNEKRSSLLVKIEALLQPALTQHHISTPESIQAALPSTVHKYAPMLSNPRLYQQPLHYYHRSLLSHLLNWNKDCQIDPTAFTLYVTFSL